MASGGLEEVPVRALTISPRVLNGAALPKKGDPLRSIDVQLHCITVYRPHHAESVPTLRDGDMHSVLSCRVRSVNVSLR